MLSFQVVIAPGDAFPVRINYRLYPPPLGAEELMNANATEDDVFLALAKHVPALSSPMGGNAVLESEDHSINMNDGAHGIPRPNGWGRTHPVFADSWLHSDMKDMAFFYVYKLYEQLVQKGNLNDQ